MFWFVGVNTLAFGHYAITHKVNNITPIERAGDDEVISAEEARHLIRPGRPWPHMFPIGEEPTAVTRAHVDAADAQRTRRLDYAIAQIQLGIKPRNDRMNCTIVNSIVSAVLEGNHRNAIDRDFDPDDVESLHTVAKNFRDQGLEPAEVKQRLRELVTVLREDFTNERAELDDGELEIDADE